MDMHVFLLKWYEKFPELKSRELFLTGESYAGVTNSNKSFMSCFIVIIEAKFAKMHHFYSSLKFYLQI